MKEHDAALKRCHSLEYKAIITTEMTRGGQTMKMGGEVSHLTVNPGKTRFESRIQGVTVLTVCDGESTWIYNSMTRQYAKKSAALGPSALLSAMGVGSLPDTSSVKFTEKTLGSEMLEVGGEKHDCWLVENHAGDLTITQPQPVTVKDFSVRYWIDKKSKIDLQMTVSMTVSAGENQMEMQQKTVKSELKVDQPIPDSEFAFTPPEGAQLVDNILGAGMPNVDLAGKEAAPFEVKTLDGTSYSLAGFKGKPVLLDFWASWCGPCRRAMPDVEALNKQFHDKGLVVLGVNTGEDRPVVESFLKQNPMAYPAVLSGESGILDAYQVTAFPTFVMIGRDGKVAAYQVGYGGIDMLRGMLAKAGVQ